MARAGHRYWTVLILLAGAYMLLALATLPWVVSGLVGQQFESEWTRVVSAYERGKDICSLAGADCDNVSMPQSEPVWRQGGLSAWRNGEAGAPDLIVAQESDEKRVARIAAVPRYETIWMLAATYVSGFAVLSAFYWLVADWLVTRRRVRALQGTDPMRAVDTDAVVRADDPVLIAFGETVDQLRAAQADLMATERVASLGYFAGGIAHQIGNPLSAARQYLEVLRTGTPDAPKREELLETIARQLERIHRAIEGLTRFARPERLQVEKIDLQTFVERVIDEVRVASGRSIQAELAIEPHCTIETDGLALEQVLINIVRNGLEAQKSDPEIAIDVRGEDRDVVIEVRDYGPGIEVDTQSIRPLGSVKPGGTGLGLPLAVRLVGLLGGRIEFGNWKHGAAVKIHIPRSATEKNATDSERIS